MKQYLEIIKSFMTEHGLSQNEMAQRLEVSGATLSRWFSSEHGITPKHRARIEFVCGCPVDQVTKKIISKIKALPIEKQWEVYDFLAKNY